ncbi:MAG: hypothetical protein M1573_01500 [Candidatus Parvarchaeota archaeon]|jgi:hypothetical protein|nr:hypothetical protein [Candidatus Parvarchaeota archaeon]MCL5017897.1 hypothetical protein [Candidatus Parvarchaeota archaeon]
MEKAYSISLIIILLLVVIAVIFYTNPYENHRSIAIGLCELACRHAIQNATSSSSISGSCLYENISYGYSCAVSASQNESICGNANTVYVSNTCTLGSVG